MKTFLEKLKELFNKSKEERQVQAVINNPILLNHVYLKVLEMQNNISPKSYIG
jgi:hypothetical protein